MTTKDDLSSSREASGHDVSPPRALTPEARRALEEAEARRRQQDAAQARPAEVGGRDGPEPTRFGDWEKGGIASDF
ncbi:DUF1674 domain-containing protein [Hyphomicrobium sp.]|jgi:hypothetical protein|uniref:DUF1674 domain-containing protein n=1 Tax=Hyphomicrobium sp. TaxID=82 RepID=UPI003569F4BB